MASSDKVFQGKAPGLLHSWMSDAPYQMFEKVDVYYAGKWVSAVIGPVEIDRVGVTRYTYEIDLPAGKRLRITNLNYLRKHEKRSDHESR